MATTPTVPLPKKGSRTNPPFGEPARMQGRTNALGKTAKWASLHGSVLICQTVRLFLNDLPSAVRSLIAA